jgi:hypothetical protein
LARPRPSTLATDRSRSIELQSPDGRVSSDHLMRSPEFAVGQGSRGKPRVRYPTVRKCRKSRLGRAATGTRFPRDTRAVELDPPIRTRERNRASAARPRPSPGDRPGGVFFTQARRAQAFTRHDDAGPKRAVQYCLFAMARFLMRSARPQLFRTPNNQAPQSWTGGLFRVHGSTQIMVAAPGSSMAFARPLFGWA